MAALQGVDLDKGVEKGRKTTKTTDEEKQQSELPVFGKPEDYKNMSEEEKDELTKTMMGQFQNWAGKRLDLEAVDQTGVKDNGSEQ